MELVTQILGFFKEKLKKMRTVWAGLDPGQKAAVQGGAVIIGMGFLVKAKEVVAGIFIAIVVNALLWKMIHDSPWWHSLMDRWGTKLDAGITIAGLVTGLSGGGSMLVVITGFMIGAYFTIFRMVLYPGQGAEKEAACAA